MRLLHIERKAPSDKSLSVSLCSKIGSDIPPYMILSHRWREDEVLYSDLTNPDPSIAQSKQGYKKLESSCELAHRLGYQYAWLDTCCIDKSSSAELSETINSMYRYYADSHICFAYLDDVNHVDQVGELEASVWFTRGWTLQELIAPKKMDFYAKDWTFIGTKNSLGLCERLATASGIPPHVFTDPSSIDCFSVSQKLSWAAGRETTREEDESYCLFGIFGVNLPPLYGEGRKNAFRRLQIEIMNNSPDHTIFAWHQTTP
ncbi:HET-domain-containing protein, partial [Periconia macrospinosa]